MSVSYQIHKSGLIERLTTETYPGGVSRHSKLITMDELLRSITIDFLASFQPQDGGGIDPQTAMLEGLRRLLRGKLSDQALQAMVDDKALVRVREEFISRVDQDAKLRPPGKKQKGKKKKAIDAANAANMPEAEQLLGIGSAQPDAKNRAFAAVRKQIKHEIGALPAIEPDAPDPKKFNWPALTRLIVFGHHVDDLRKKGLPPKSLDLNGDEPPEPPNASNVVLTLDVEGLCKHLGLDPEETAYLLHFKEGTLAELPRVLSEATGKRWDKLRVFRVRKRIERAWGKIEAAVPGYVNVVTDGRWLLGHRDCIEIRSISGQATYVHAALFKLFS